MKTTRECFWEKRERLRHIPALRQKTTQELLVTQTDPQEFDFPRWIARKHPAPERYVSILQHSGRWFINVIMKTAQCGARFLVHRLYYYLLVRKNYSVSNEQYNWNWGVLATFYYLSEADGIPLAHPVPPSIPALIHLSR